MGEEGAEGGLAICQGVSTLSLKQSATAFHNSAWVSALV